MVDVSTGSHDRILVVEDDDDIRESLAELLRGEGFETVAVRDGEEALSTLRASLAFDLILLDLMLPKIDGWQFRVIQRSDPLLSAIPVVAISANRAAQASAIDADAYLAKPFRADDLIATVRRVLEQRHLMHLDRLAALGRLAAGIAHEVNNPLTVIYAGLSVAQTILADRHSNLPVEPDVREARLATAEASIGKALEGVDRVRAIMDRVRSFIRAPDESRAPVDVRQVIEASLSMLDHEVGSKATLEKDFGEVPPIFGNAGQLGQLFVNLITNALDSMPSGARQANRLTIRTSTSRSGDAVVEVTDTGAGMAEGVHARVFDPFFTTKGHGSRAGLGLSISYGIVRSHGGAIEVESQPGQGSRFRIAFPSRTVATKVEVVEVPYPNRRVLIIDDDRSLRESLARLLARDHDPMVAGDADAAFKLLDDEQKPDVILCDFHLGQTTGQDIYDRLRQTRSELIDRLIFMTGAVFTESARKFLDGIPNPCLEKPFTPAEFRKAIGCLPSRTDGASRTRLRASAAGEAAPMPLDEPKLGR
jgi:signal transduction histidine kinase